MSDAVFEEVRFTPPADAADKARQMRFLQSRGFTSNVIRQVITDGTRRHPEFNE